MPEYAKLILTGSTSPDNVATQDSFVTTLSASGTTIERATPSVPAAKSGQVTTQTNTTNGVATMDAGHGFVTNDLIDLFWSGGQRRAMTATVAVDAVTLDGGSGDDFPVVNTNVTAMVPTEEDFVVVGNNALFLGVSSPAPGFIVFVDDAAADIAAATYTLDASGGQCWISGNGTNPLASKTTSKVKFSHGQTTAKTMKAAVVS